MARLQKQRAQQMNVDHMFSGYREAEVAANKARMEAARQEFSVEEHLRPGLPRQDPDGEPVHGEITATRMFRRPSEQPEQPVESVEPAQLGCAVLYGPHMFNFGEITHMLEAAGGALPVADGDALTRETRRLLTDDRARERIVAHKDEERTEFLRRRGFSKAETGKIIDAVLAEEGRPPESIFDFVQGITAVARDKPHQDARLELEGKAKKLLDRAA